MQPQHDDFFGDDDDDNDNDVDDNVSRVHLIYRDFEFFVPIFLFGHIITAKKINYILIFMDDAINELVYK